MGKNRKQWYAVAIGRTPGVYKSWPEAQEQVHKFPGARFKGFATYADARSFAGAGVQHSTGHLGVAPQQFKSVAAQPAQRYSMPAASLGDLQSHESVQVFFDGGSRGNPGTAGCGAAVFSPGGEQLAADCAFLGVATSNEAEYQGLILGLQLALRTGARAVDIHGDSKLVVNQLTGTWQIRNARLARLLRLVQDHLLPQLNAWTAVHVPRGRNGVADQLANEAMDLGGSAHRPSEQL